MNTFKTIGIVFAIIVVTTLAIDASDTLQGSGGTMLAALIGIDSSSCPLGMVPVSGALTFSCVDRFEASAGGSCPITDPANQFDTEVNIAKSKCVPESNEEGLAWRHLTREQARLLCTKAGKRLPTAAEWYEFALGTPAVECNTNSAVVERGEERTTCTSAAGAEHAIGNVWEWVRDDVIDGQYLGRTLPETGYVLQVDDGGIATVTSREAGEDQDGYAWFPTTGAYGMIRGGYFGSREDAGMHTVHAATDPNFRGGAVGFRCIK